MFLFFLNFLKILGETIQTNMWLEKEDSEYKVYFECKVVETGISVISGAYVTLHNIKSDESAVAKTESAYVVLTDQEAFVADRIFEELSMKVKSSPAIAKAVNTVYEFHITKGTKTKVYGKIK